MSVLYRPRKTFIIELVDGTKYKYENRRFKIRYGLPSEDVENYGQATLKPFIDRYYFYFSIYEAMFKKGKYMVFDYEDEKIFLDKISTIDVVINYIKVPEYTSIKEIAEDLPHDEFLQFVVDKEQELRSVITSMGE